MSRDGLLEFRSAFPARLPLKRICHQKPSCSGQRTAWQARGGKEPSVAHHKSHSVCQRVSPQPAQQYTSSVYMHQSLTPLRSPFAALKVNYAAAALPAPSRDPVEVTALHVEHPPLTRYRLPSLCYNVRCTRRCLTGSCECSGVVGSFRGHAQRQVDLTFSHLAAPQRAPPTRFSWVLAQEEGSPLPW